MYFAVKIPRLSFPKSAPWCLRDQSFLLSPFVEFVQFVGKPPRFRFPAFRFALSIQPPRPPRLRFLRLPSWWKETKDFLDCADALAAEMIQVERRDRRPSGGGQTCDLITKKTEVLGPALLERMK